jgi:hypothetical protein
VLTELWRNQSTYQTPKDETFTVSEPILIKKGPNKGKKRFPDDRAAGVGILLSPTALKKVESFGSQGERVCWVRLKGPICHLFVIGVYLPHRGRTQPSQDDTLLDLEKVLSIVPQGDCICVAGDFNEQLPANAQGRTGVYVGGQASANSDKIVQLLQRHDLVAANTLFTPKKFASVHTFLQTKRKDMETDMQDDCDEYVGRAVQTKYKGKTVTDTVEANLGTQGGEREWVVRFKDKYVRRYTRKELEKILLVVETDKVGKQLDYVMVSARRVSCVTQCRPKWGPSKHRDLHGHKNDHALVECTWRWRLKAVRPQPVKDYDCLYEQKADDDGNPIKNEMLQAFEDELEHKLGELDYSMYDSAAEMYRKFCTAVAHAVDTVLPTVKKKKGIRRKISDKTKSLFEQRKNMKGTKEEYAKVQSEIKESSLDDFKQWVSEWADDMQGANGRGDTRAIYNAVKALASKKNRPQKNLAVDGQGSLLKNAEDVAEA